MIQSPSKKEGKMVLVKEPSEFIRGKYKLSAFTLKVLAFLFSKIDPFEDEPFKKYEISVTELQEVYGKKYGEIYNIVKKTFRELMDIKIELEYEDKWSIFTIVVDPTILKRNGTITFFISPNLLNLLKKSKHFLKYNISVLAYFNSSYSVRLYKILKDRLEINNKFKENNKYEISLKAFKELLHIPKKYLYGKIKEKVLNRALQEINNYSDIQVDFEPIKKGRKVEKLVFYINSKKEDKPFASPPKREEKSVNSNLKQFRQEIIQKFSNQEKYFIIEDNTFKIKEDLLFVNEEALKASEALTWWKYIYKNKDKIKEIDPSIAREEAKKEYENFLELRKEYKEKNILIKYRGEVVTAKVSDILSQEGGYKIYLLTDKEELKNSALEEEFITLEELKNFLKICRESYLKTKE